MNQPPSTVIPSKASPPTFSLWQSNWLWSLLLAILTALLASNIIGEFRHPMSDGNDTDQYEYVGYFFNKNLTLWPFPHLNLLHNQSFYPYGLNQVFLDWGFERDYWYSVCLRLFGGPGPYLQYYYVYSLVISAVGTFLLLRSRYGLPKSFAAGLIVSIFNIFALFKFPVHMNVCVDHWTVLCMVATYILLLDILDRRPVSLLFFLLWAWLHVQVLSQELAYVAGLALTFTTLSIPVMAFTLYRQYPTWRHWPALLQAYFTENVRRQPGNLIVIFCLLLVSLWLYLPLTLQIAFTAWQFDFGAVPELRAWSHPARLFIPYLPGINGHSIPYQNWFHDTFESYGQGSPGLYIIMLAGIGWWQTRRRVALWLPIVSMLVLCLLYHPILIPTLKLFPWFSFNRHGGRASLVYPVLLTLLALPVRWPGRRPARLGVLFLLGLMGMEWYTGYTQRIHAPVSVVSDSMMRYFSIVRQQPGEAVLDWPFCTIGANGIGQPEGLCPFAQAQNAVFSYRRFYDKSVVGQYFGRLHPDQIQPFLRDGWPQRLTPDRPFTEHDWQFMDTFLRNNNFAGINLYLDLLPPAEVAKFYSRYGSPIAETSFPAAGRVVFIALNPHKKRY